MKGYIYGTQAVVVTGRSLLLDKGEYEDKQVDLFPGRSVIRTLADEWKCN